MALHSVVQIVSTRQASLAETYPEDALVIPAKGQSALRDPVASGMYESYETVCSSNAKDSANDTQSTDDLPGHGDGGRGDTARFEWVSKWRFDNVDRQSVASSAGIEGIGGDATADDELQKLDSGESLNQFPVAVPTASDTGSIGARSQPSDRKGKERARASSTSTNLRRQKTEDRDKRVVVYNISLGGTYCCSRRYREFAALARHLKDMYGYSASLPARWPMVLNTEQVRARKLRLEKMMNEILGEKLVANDPMVHHFLEPHAIVNRADFAEKLLSWMADEANTDADNSVLFDLRGYAILLLGNPYADMESQQGHVDMSKNHRHHQHSAHQQKQDDHDQNEPLSLPRAFSDGVQNSAPQQEPSPPTSGRVSPIKKVATLPKLAIEEAKTIDRNVKHMGPLVIQRGIHNLVSNMADTVTKLTPRALQSRSKSVNSDRSGEVQFFTETQDEVMSVESDSTASEHSFASPMLKSETAPLFGDGVRLTKYDFMLQEDVESFSSSLNSSLRQSPPRNHEVATSSTPRGLGPSARNDYKDELVTIKALPQMKLAPAIPASHAVMIDAILDHVRRINKDTSTSETKTQIRQGAADDRQAMRERQREDRIRRAKLQKERKAEKKRDHGSSRQTPASPDMEEKDQSVLDKLRDALAGREGRKEARQKEQAIIDNRKRSLDAVGRDMSIDLVDDELMDLASAVSGPRFSSNPNVLTMQRSLLKSNSMAVDEKEPVTQDKGNRCRSDEPPTTALNSLSSRMRKISETSAASGTESQYGSTSQHVRTGAAEGETVSIKSGSASRAAESAVAAPVENPLSMSIPTIFSESPLQKAFRAVDRESLKPNIKLQPTEWQLMDANSGIRVFMRSPITVTVTGDDTPVPILPNALSVMSMDDKHQPLPSKMRERNASESAEPEVRLHRLSMSLERLPSAAVVDEATLSNRLPQVDGVQLTKAERTVIERYARDADYRYHLREVKAESLMFSPPQAVFEQLYSLTHRRDIDPAMATCAVVNRINEQTRVERWRFHKIWPISYREFRVLSHFQIQRDGTIVLLYFSLPSHDPLAEEEEAGAGTATKKATSGRPEDSDGDPLERIDSRSKRKEIQDTIADDQEEGTIFYSAFWIRPLGTDLGASYVMYAGCVHMGYGAPSFVDHYINVQRPLAMLSRVAERLRTLDKETLGLISLPRNAVPQVDDCIGVNYFGQTGTFVGAGSVMETNLSFLFLDRNMHAFLYRGQAKGLRQQQQQQQRQQQQMVSGGDSTEEAPTSGLLAPATQTEDLPSKLGSPRRTADQSGRDDMLNFIDNASTDVIEDARPEAVSLLSRIRPILDTRERTDIAMALSQAYYRMQYMLNAPVGSEGWISAGVADGGVRLGMNPSQTQFQLIRAEFFTKDLNPRQVLKVLTTPALRTILMPGLRQCRVRPHCRLHTETSGFDVDIEDNNQQNTDFLAETSPVRLEQWVYGNYLLLSPRHFNVATYAQEDDTGAIFMVSTTTSSTGDDSDSAPAFGSVEGTIDYLGFILEPVADTVADNARPSSTLFRSTPTPSGRAAAGTTSGKARAAASATGESKKQRKGKGPAIDVGSGGTIVHMVLAIDLDTSLPPFMWRGFAEAHAFALKEIPVVHRRHAAKLSEAKVSTSGSSPGPPIDAINRPLHPFEAQDPIRSGDAQSEVLATIYSSLCGRHPGLTARELPSPERGRNPAVSPLPGDEAATSVTSNVRTLLQENQRRTVAFVHQGGLVLSRLVIAALYLSLRLAYTLVWLFLYGTVGLTAGMMLLVLARPLFQPLLLTAEVRGDGAFGWTATPVQLSFGISASSISFQESTRIAAEGLLREMTAVTAGDHTAFVRIAMEGGRGMFIAVMRGLELVPGFERTSEHILGVTGLVRDLAVPREVLKLPSTAVGVVAVLCVSSVAAYFSFVVCLAALRHLILIAHNTLRHLRFDGTWSFRRSVADREKSDHELLRANNQVSPKLPSWLERASDIPVRTLYIDVHEAVAALRKRREQRGLSAAVSHLLAKAVGEVLAPELSKLGLSPNRAFGGGLGSQDLSVPEASTRTQNSAGGMSEADFDLCVTQCPSVTGAVYGQNYGLPDPDSGESRSYDQEFDGDDSSDNEDDDTILHEGVDIDEQDMDPTVTSAFFGNIVGCRHVVLTRIRAMTLRQVSHALAMRWAYARPTGELAAPSLLPATFLRATTWLLGLTVETQRHILHRAHCGEAGMLVNIRPPPPSSSASVARTKGSKKDSSGTPSVDMDSSVALPLSLLDPAQHGGTLRSGLVADLRALRWYFGRLMAEVWYRYVVNDPKTPASVWHQFHHHRQPSMPVAPAKELTTRVMLRTLLFGLGLCFYLIIWWPLRELLRTVFAEEVAAVRDTADSISSSQHYHRHRHTHRGVGARVGGVQGSLSSQQRPSALVALLGYGQRTLNRRLVHDLAAYITASKPKAHYTPVPALAPSVSGGGGSSANDNEEDAIEQHGPLCLDDLRVMILAGRIQLMQTPSDMLQTVAAPTQCLPGGIGGALATLGKEALFKHSKSGSKTQAGQGLPRLHLVLTVAFDGSVLPHNFASTFGRALNEAMQLPA
eukprot:Clim_evm27s227 gene=Clim_evmTU27s227